MDATNSSTADFIINRKLCENVINSNIIVHTTIYINIYIYLICIYLYFYVLLLVFSVICMHQGSESNAILCMYVGYMWQNWQ